MEFYSADIEMFMSWWNSLQFKAIQVTHNNVSKEITGIQTNVQSAHPFEKF
jgi:hypothetical protein